jgi:hypothetical protein
MIVTVDAKRRIVLPGVKPGDAFYVKAVGSEFRLTRLELGAPRDTARLVRKHRFLLASGTRPITQERVRNAQDEFP